MPEEPECTSDRYMRIPRVFLTTPEDKRSIFRAPLVQADWIHVYGPSHPPRLLELAEFRQRRRQHPLQRSALARLEQEMGPVTAGAPLHGRRRRSQQADVRGFAQASCQELPGRLQERR